MVCSNKARVGRTVDKINQLMRESQYLEVKRQFSGKLVLITFEPIEVQTRSAPQTDRLNLSFVKDIYVDGRKLARNGRKTARAVSNRR